MNLEAVDELLEQFPDIQIVFIESGGDNLSATFSPELADATILLLMWRKAIRFPEKEVRALPVRICSLSIKSIWRKW